MTKATLLHKKSLVFIVLALAGILMCYHLRWYGNKDLDEIDNVQSYSGVVAKYSCTKDRRGNYYWKYLLLMPDGNSEQVNFTSYGFGVSCRELFEPVLNQVKNNILSVSVINGEAWQLSIGGQQLIKFEDVRSRFNEDFFQFSTFVILTFGFGAIVPYCKRCQKFVIWYSQLFRGNTNKK